VIHETRLEEFRGYREGLLRIQDSRQTMANPETPTNNAQPAVTAESTDSNTRVEAVEDVPPPGEEPPPKRVRL
jgi:hypothetical protein